MSDLKSYIRSRKKHDKAFADQFEEGYAEFKMGVVLREARRAAGFTQEQLAKKLHTQKTAISRLEKHAQDIRLSTLEKIAFALGRHVEVRIV